MVNQTVITVFTALNMWFVGGTAAAGQAQIAQATAERTQTDRVASQVVAAEARGNNLIRHKTVQLNRYEIQLKEVDRLKRRRASWRRDRMLRRQLAASHKTARGLSRVARQLRTLGRRLRVLRKRLVKAANAELAKAPSRQRRARLIAWRNRARRFLRPRSKKIIMPDSTVDPLADPEDLEEQAAQLLQTERRLAREIRNLQRRASRFRRMARLRRLRARAARLRRIDSSRPRRVTQRVRTNDRNQGAGLSSTETGDGSSSPGDDSFSSGDPLVDTSNPVIVLANVVNARVLNALRRAQTSNDPLVKAGAADRARKQVKARLERLRGQRMRIIRRARKLRRRR